MMNDQVKGLYINLLTNKSARYRIVKVIETKQRASLAKANTINKKIADAIAVPSKMIGRRDA